MIIKVCPGIGDNIWLLMKLWQCGQQFDWRIQDGQPRRGLPLFDMAPHLVKSAEYEKIPGGYKTLLVNNAEKRYKLWRNITKPEIYLSANQHLEAGKRIEKFLPDLPTTFRIPWELGEYEDLYPLKGKWIGIYGSSYSTARAWGFWNADGWAKLVKLVHDYNPEYQFVLIGADFDMDMNSGLSELLAKDGVQHLNITGMSLQGTAAIIKQLHYFFAFPSGLPILAHTMGIPLTMFYPPHLKLMMNTWARPEDIESGHYKGCQFCDPETIFDWAVKNNKI